MTVTPKTTKLGPDQAFLRGLMRRLAEATSTEAPILSCYLDVRPEAHGERPAERNELTIVRNRLDAIAGEHEAHTAPRESIDTDRARIDALLDDADQLAGADGVAIFACDRIGLWEVARTQIAFDTEVSAGPTVDLFQLAKLLDDQISAVVAVVDTNTCRLFVTRRGGLAERSGPDEDPSEHRRHQAGGWSQARFQRHVDMQDKRFAKEAADAILRLVGREKPAHVILAGDERSIPTLDGELSEEVRPLVEHVARLDVRASLEEVGEEVFPVLAALEEADARTVAERAIAGWRAGDLGVVGLNATMAALDAGQVDELVLDETVEMDPELRGELIRQASLTDARVEVVADHPEIARHEGVAATLRYRV